MAAMQSFGLCSWCLLWILSTSRACAVGAVRPAQLRPVGAGQVLGGDGRPAVGHPHGAALRHHGRRRDEEAPRPQHAGENEKAHLGPGIVTLIHAEQSERCLG